MAGGTEIKVTSGIDGEIKTLKSAGSSLESSSSVSSGSNLPTSKKYIEYCRAMADVMGSLKTLVENDTRQIKTFVKAMRDQDNS